MENNLYVPANESPHVRNDYVWIDATPTEFVKKSAFYFLSLGIFDTIEGYDLIRDYMDSYLIIFTESGEGIINANGTEFKTHKNHACLIDCRKPHSYRASDKWKFRWMHIDGSGMEYIYEQLMPIASTGVDINRTDEFFELFDDIQKTAVDNYSLFIAKQGLDIHNMLYMLISAAQEAMNLKPVFFDVFSYIDENYGEQIDVDTLASIAHMSKYHFTRQFKKLVGDSPYHYITNYRINRSKLLLTAGGRTISEISLMCGFLSESNYISQFKKQVGMTPDRYRASRSIA